jgi:hypothetical protein
MLRQTMHPFSSSHCPGLLQGPKLSLLVFVTVALFQFRAETQGAERPFEHHTSYRNIQIDGLSIFYREAGPKDTPTLLLLHGNKNA